MHVSNPIYKSYFWQYTERSSHSSVRVGEEASVCAMTMCVCVPLCVLPVCSRWQALVCVETAEVTISTGRQAPLSPQPSLSSPGRQDGL